MTTDAGASGAGPPLAPPKTFTFLFTDIEGSTQLWEEHPEAMRVALARHDALLRGAIGANDGTVFKTIGDAFCAVFPAAGDAVRAALDAQKSLHRDAPWEGAAAAARPRVRMALHAGEAEARDGDYFGPPLNRVARLLQIAHGGQTLLSEVAAALARGAAAGLPDGADLLDLGEHRLRDLQHPERVFQLLHPELPADFPPPRSLSALPNNLPRQVSRFIGRKAEMGTIQDLLRRSRLVTLTGTGGGGKTRLALQAAAERLEDYRAGGVWLVELGSLPSSGSPWQALATALAVPETPGRSLERDADHAAEGVAARRCSCWTTASTSWTRPHASPKRCCAPARPEHPGDQPPAARDRRRDLDAGPAAVDPGGPGAPAVPGAAGRIRGAAPVLRPRHRRLARLRDHRRERAGGRAHLPPARRHPARHRADGGVGCASSRSPRSRPAWATASGS
jgi:class 3 adenylate cyclase